MESLFDRIGGEAAVSAAVAKLYQKILDDDMLAAFFDDIDLDKLRHSQSAFVTMAFGGAPHYTGKGLRRAHKRLVENGLGDAHFDAVANHLRDAMNELQVPADLTDEAMAIVETTRDDVLNR